MSYGIIKIVPKIRRAGPRLRGENPEKKEYVCTKPGFTTVRTSRKTEAQRLVDKEGYTCLQLLDD